MKSTLLITIAIILLTALSILIVPLRSSAQSTTKYGIKGGLNISALKGYGDNIAYTTDWKQQIGFHAGVFARIPVTSIFALQPEILYSMKGASAIYTIPRLFQGTGNYRLAYAELPLLLTFKLSKIVELQAGPYVAYLITANSVTEGLFYPNLLIRNSFDKFDYGAAGGVNFLWQKLLIGVRYTQGLPQVGVDAIFPDTLLGNSKNAVGMLSVGYILN